MSNHAVAVNRSTGTNADRRTFVRCVDCRTRSSAVVRDDGTYRLPTTHGNCRCGGNEFIELEGLLGEESDGIGR